MSDARAAWANRGVGKAGRWVSGAAERGTVVWWATPTAIRAVLEQPTGEMEALPPPSADAFEAAWRSAGTAMQLADAEADAAYEAAWEGRR